MIKLSKLRGKIISASESYIQRDLSHRVIRFPQKPFRFLQPDSLHILHKGHMEIIFKKTAKVAFAHGQIRRKGIQHNTLGMVFFHKTYDFLIISLFLVFVFTGLISPFCSMRIS